MIRIAALNDSTVNQNESTTQPEVATKEAQEEEAFTLYNKALQLQNHGIYEKAEEAFNKLLNINYLIEAVPKDETEPLLRPNLLLKYSTFKNLASIAAHRKDYNKAMESYLEAVSLDATDVTLWYKIGTTALAIYNYTLARLAFQEGLKCNPDHWPCLDNLVTVLYALNDYTGCLYYISLALEREANYIKGFAFRDQIFHEQPSLREETCDLFKKCRDAIYRVTYEKEEGDKYIQESLEMRKMKRELSKPPEPPVLSFTKPWVSYTWKCLGQCLVALYNHISNADPPMSFTYRIDLGKYLDPSSLEPEEECIPIPPTDVAETIGNISTPQQNTLISITPQPVILSADSASNGSVQVTVTGGDTPTPMEVEETVVHHIDTPYSHMVGTRRRAKRKYLSPECIDIATKRRSARVRNVGGKKQDNVNYIELLQKFLPSSLIYENKEDNQGSLLTDPCAKITIQTQNGTNDKEAVICEVIEDPEFANTEESEIKEFLKNCDINNGIIDVLYKYLVALSKKHNLTWSSGLADIYVSAYIKLRSHINHPLLLSNDYGAEVIKDEGWLTLVYCELQLDKWQFLNRKSAALSPSGIARSPALSAYVPLGPDFLGKYYQEDLEFILHCTVRKDIFEPDWMDFYFRVLWLRAHFLILQGQVDMALDCFDKIVIGLKSECNLDPEFTLKLKNCCVDNLISNDEVQKQLEALQRCQSLEEVHRLHEAGDYDKVIELLIPTFNQPPPKNKVDSNKSIPERHAQLQLLQDALLKKGDLQECLFWSEVALTEAIQQYKTAVERSSKINWAGTMMHLISGLQSCVSAEKDIFKTLESGKLVRLAKNLIHLIAIQMESASSYRDINFSDLTSWILLYHLIEYEEIKIRTLAGKKDATAAQSNTGTEEVLKNDFGPFVPSSLMLLYNAHECLGRRSWCCNSGGSLLLLYVDVLLRELSRYSSGTPHPYKEDLETSLEQCFYCLYGHPHKRTKAKHLQEHSSHQVSLTWQRALPVFNYFKPKQEPEFDSYKTCPVSGELENLLRRITLLVPAENEPANTLETVSAYIEGITEIAPALPQDKPITLPIVKELYYLLADFYFKNKEFGKAIKYYILDICVNPERFDSWAGMALARSSQLEQKLNSVGGLEEELGESVRAAQCELKSEGPIYRKSTSALRCYKRALEIDKNYAHLWIEYGASAYMLHSHASRQIKQHTQFGLSSEIIDMLKAKREEMLQLAEQCFTSASQCERGGEEEQWLHHYMLGKINEKMGRSVYISLEHYRIAAEHLHENDARYPRKITYHNPPELSIESLEVYYRLHASILKFLLKHENKELPENAAETFQKYLKAAAEGPFANFQEKRYSSLSSSDVEDPTPPPPGETSEKYALPCVIYDHDYFRRKQKDSSAEESETDPFVRRSVDSSSESLDSATVKDILNSIVSVVSEKCVSSEDANQSVPGLVVLGDMKIKKMVSMIEAPKEKTEKVEDAPTNPVKPNETVQFNTPYTSTVDSTTPEISQSGTSAPVSRSDSVTEDSDIEIISATIKSETLMQQVQELEKDITKEKGETVDNLTQSSVSSTTGEAKISTTENSAKTDSEKNTDAQITKSEEKKETELQPNSAVQTGIGKTEEKLEQVTPEKATEQNLDHNELIFQCLAAMKLCLQRFPQHYKSLYRIAHYHCYSKYYKNLQWSRDYLLGNSSIPWQNLSHMPSQGLFSERKNTNFFNGIWRIPNDDIDRPGSFGSHMFRSVILVLEVLKQMKDYNLLVHLTIQMHRNPDIGKKFLRDVDRLYLAGRSLNGTLQTLKDELGRLCDSEPTMKCQQKIIQHLLIIYRAWHNLLKSINKTEEINGLLEESYRKVKNLEGESISGISLLDQAIRFCQQKQQLAKLSQSPHRSEVPKILPPVSSTVATMLPSHVSTLEDELNASKIASHQEIPQENEAFVGERSPALSGETYATKRDAKSYESYSDLMKKDNSSSGKIDSCQSTQVGLANQTVETGHSKGKPNGNKPGWASNSIPASGMVIGSMTIMPVMSNQPSSAEGLMGRLVSAQPRLAQNTTPVKRASTSLPKTTPPTKPNMSASQSFPSFDPGRLTADVQSKITSLDPLEPSKQQTSMSGFQMEFLRQLAQKQTPSPKVPKSPVGPVVKGSSSSHQAWGSRGPVAAPPPAVPVSSNNQTKSPASITKTLSSSTATPPSTVPASSNQNKLFPSVSKTLHSGSIAIPSSSDKSTGASVPANSDNQTKTLISFPKSYSSPVVVPSSTVPVNTNNQSKTPAIISETSLSAFPSSDINLVSTPLRVASSSLPATSSKSNLSSPPHTPVLPTKTNSASNESGNLASVVRSGSISQDSLNSPVTSPSSPDKQAGSSCGLKPSFALRSIRIPSITQEPARKMPPPPASKPTLSSKANTLGLKPLLDTDIEVITLLSSSSQDEME